MLFARSCKCWPIFKEKMNTQIQQKDGVSPSGAGLSKCSHLSDTELTHDLYKSSI